MFDLHRDEVLFPDGRRASFEVIRHGGTVAILPQEANGDFLFVRQYRHAVQSMLLEIPAGRLESGENPLECAQREIREEIGMAAAQWQDMGSFLWAPGYSNEVISLFFAYDLSPESLPQDDDEEIEIVRISPADALEQLQRGQITDAKTALALMLYTNNQ